MPRATSWTRFLIISLLLLIPAIILQQSTTVGGRILQRANAIFETTLQAQQSLTTTTSMMNKTPVYFLSHGGPNIMEDIKHPAYKKLQEIGQEITTKVKPKAIVVFSAHWQGFQDTIEVNTMESGPLIYDFYGFPVRADSPISRIEPLILTSSIGTLLQVQVS